MGEALFPCGATYLRLSEIAPVMAEQLKQKFSSFLDSPSLLVLYSGRIFQRFQKASAAGKNRAQNYPVVLWVSSPWWQAQCYLWKSVPSAGIPQTAPGAAMQILINVGHHLQNRSKHPGIHICWQMDIRVLISNMCIWWSTCKVT